MGVARTARAVRLPASVASEPPDPPRLPSRRAAAHTCCTRCRAAHRRAVGVCCGWLQRRVHAAVKGDARQRPCPQVDRAVSAATARAPIPSDSEGVACWSGGDEEAPQLTGWSAALSALTFEFGFQPTFDIQAHIALKPATPPLSTQQAPPRSRSRTSARTSTSAAHRASTRPSDGRLRAASSSGGGRALGGSTRGTRRRRIGRQSRRHITDIPIPMDCMRVCRA